jgi:hypothetical protein
LRDTLGEAHPVAHRIADRLAQRRRHARGSGAGCEPSRLEHDDLPSLRPRLARQHERHARGLAGARRGHQHRHVARSKRGRKLRQRVIDGQWLGEHHVVKARIVG